ncbi:hypothetical protein [Polymorphospora sp. NPDC050346]|uniref:hypothetical protein n=1 Tax=Polymorphospora sp. NPDC050346 TaxID=3155780 RepID=UPI0033C27926
MRLLLACLVAIVSVGLVAFGGVSALAGFLDQRAADRVYVVQFKRPGDECGGARQLHLDVTDGKPLSCRPGYAGVVGGYARNDLPGFADAQNEQVLALAEGLGGDGLSSAEQRQIQDRVDQILATVPAAERPDRKPGLWGARQAWLGGGLAMAGVIGLVALLLLAIRATKRGR